MGTFEIIRILIFSTLAYNINIIPINPPQSFFLSKKHLEKAVRGLDLSDIKVNCKTRETETMEYG